MQAPSKLRRAACKVCIRGTPALVVLLVALFSAVITARRGRRWVVSGSHGGEGRGWRRGRVGGCGAWGRISSIADGRRRIGGCSTWEGVTSFCDGGRWVCGCGLGRRICSIRDRRGRVGSRSFGRSVSSVGDGRRIDGSTRLRAIWHRPRGRSSADIPASTTISKIFTSEKGRRQNSPSVSVSTVVKVIVTASSA